ncbi:putative peptidoglycan binding domain protein [Actinokineospora spheciospongiae]|uniref:Putative peptidoglycan binding domain protein n=1 Tax=Actinokineospora spheciospongiae TaxID=909613 RepID=W7J6Z9_9PSEU|nr:glycoside hydrolase domain-containing protein [Actinokineospora spheciospongiae]EWC61824.1 putative peptidoglycan binding domain protein [Actinokineospora spheciospongiae]
MVDEMVVRAQRFINSYSVAGIPKVAENGKTGWPVMYALTRALQYELGITALSDSFGPTTLAALQSRFPVVDAGTRHANAYRIVQSALYCKGYDGGNIDGTFNSRVSTAVTRLKQDMGVSAAYPGDGVTPKVFKALLTMDAYVTLSGGGEQIRSVQQWLNGRHQARRNFFIIPCDGHFSRDVQKALVYAIQYEIGMGDDVANGVFGPGTRDGIRAHPLATGSTGTWVSLFSAALVFNQRPGVAFTSAFGSDLAAAVRSFQAFVALPVTGTGDFATWASLLVSTGDATRRGTAADCVTEVTADRAVALRAAGYRVVGRYLANAPGSSLNKQIQPGELQRLRSFGLNSFPIYQTLGGSADYFSHQQGVADALAAVQRARHHGYRPGTRIYFAVDFDALDHQVTEGVLPHFRAIAATAAQYGAEYRVGIYGPRNVCSRVAAEGLADASFVSDMSTGFSGNLGYPMPANWAFDQISTISVGSGSGAIEIDNNISSGRDPGQSSYDPEVPDSALDVSFDPAKRDALLADVRAYLEGRGVPETGGDGWQALTLNSTTEAVDVVLALDWLITRLARSYRMRKALIQCPLLWEYRAYNVGDPAADALVRQYHEGTGVGPADSSTGLGQVFARTAITATNHCVRQGVIGGQLRNPDADADLWEVWQKLNGDPVYNVGVIPAVHVWGAADIGVARPNPLTNEDDSRRIMARYNGTANSSVGYGVAMVDLYRIFERYQAPLRS